MDTGQMSMMPASAGVATLAATQLASPPAGLAEAGEQAGGNFVGVLQGMTAQKVPQGAGAVSAGKGAPASAPPEKDGGTDAAMVVQDGMTGLMAGLLNALDMSAKPLATTDAEPTTDVPPAGTSAAKPQDVALNADGIQSALLVQMNGSRMLQADGTVIQQNAAAPASEVSTTTGGTQPALPIRTNGSRMLRADGTAAQPNTAALVPETAVATDDGAMATPAALAAGIDGGQKPAGDAGLPTAAQTAPAKESPLPGASQGPAAAQPVMAAAEQNALMTNVGNLSTERGTASNGRTGSAGDATLSRADSNMPGSAGGKTAPPAQVNVEQQQAVILPRSAALEAALAGGPTQKDGSTTEPAKTVPSAPTAQNAQAPETLLATAGKVSPDAQLPNQAAATADTRTSSTGDGTRAASTGVVPEAGKKGAELGGETAQTRVERGAVAKAVASASVDVAQSPGDAPTGGEFSSGGEKGAADQFTNGQFQTTAVHQQGKIEGASVASNIAAPVQNSGQRPELSEQIMQQVKDRLVNHEVKTGTDQIVLKLSPENLGDLRVNMSMDGQRLKVEIVAENRMVRDALLQNTDSLKESLARQNISMESFDVTTAGRGGAGNPGQGQQQNAWREFAEQKQQSAWLSSGGYRLPDTATAVSSQLAYQTPSQHTMVDLHF
ncbi:flagellar hook-length control protein FliK [Oryzomonas rubra]|uniref:Flagellar hook-length control protein FliK n=1 Tax=Oryzomonas rubra TaxID=2509454 RepID=A0A5A9XA61_9BACT|nr:flagellar hook-length control protein FliK [Oryzomonas rubra]KAA0889744.1 flagellar hook-length control protein FliK [Oryzomonas rubra]